MHSPQDKQAECTSTTPAFAQSSAQIPTTLDPNRWYLIWFWQAATGYEYCIEGDGSRITRILNGLSEDSPKPRRIDLLPETQDASKHWRMTLAATVPQTGEANPARIRRIEEWTVTLCGKCISEYLKSKSRNTVAGYAWFGQWTCCINGSSNDFVCAMCRFGHVPGSGGPGISGWLHRIGKALT